jgi:hypothetical protein
MPQLEIVQNSKLQIYASFVSQVCAVREAASLL